MGIETAEILGKYYNKKVIPANHLEGHIYAAFVGEETLKNPKIQFQIEKTGIFPILALVVSGGHTSLILMRDHLQYETIGQTIDDAAGEAFDKSAKLLGLGYPGGPAISRMAEFGDPGAYQLPRPMLHSKNFDFSFSGLKTAVLTVVKNHPGNVCEQDKANIARAFVDAMVEVLVAKCMSALKHTGMKRLVIAGGVGANKQLREGLNAAAAKRRYQVFYPELEFCTDNGAMIAFAGAMRLQQHPQAAKRDYAFSVRPRWPLDEIAIPA